MNSLSKQVLGWALSAVLSISAFEGVKYYAYKDPLGIPTVCAGHTGSDVKFGKRYTPAECDALLTADIKVAYSTIERCYPDIDKRTDGEKEAWASFTLNVGPGRRGVKDGFCMLKSGNRPALLRKLEAGDYRGACNELPKWVHPANLRGLAIRRGTERDICLRDLP